MKELVQQAGHTTPVLFPYQPEKFLEETRRIVREELDKIRPLLKNEQDILQTPGLTHKPLLKITEVCALFQVSKPTIYAWIEHGKLKPFKVRSRVYFLWQDIRLLMEPGSSTPVM